MSLFKRTVPPVPEVPDDAAERKAAIQRSQDKLDEAFDSIAHTKNIMEQLDVHILVNHYAHRLRVAYGVEGDDNG